jgi:hypothetical protein
MLNKQIISRHGKMSNDNTTLKYVKDVSLVFNLCDLPMSKRVEQDERSNAPPQRAM